MKRSQIILFSLFLFLTGLMYFTLLFNKKDNVKTEKKENLVIYIPTKKVANKPRHLSIVSYGQITPNSEINIAVEVQGKLLKGQLIMKPGTKFSAGQILFRIDNEEAFYNLSASKSRLVNLMLSTLPDIELDFPSEKDKWIQFMKAILPNKLMPQLPPFASTKERMLITSRNIIAEYYSLMSQEVRMEKYIYVAPFSGTVISTSAEPGSIVSPGMQIARIAKTGNFEIKVPINVDNLEVYKTKSIATFTNTSGDTIGTGKIIRISDVINQQTQSADVYYNLSPRKSETIYHGLFVNVTINKEAKQLTTSLPRTALKDNKVAILENNKIIYSNVSIVGSKPDTVFVTGLKNKQEVLLEQVDVVKENITYKGINR